ncbi:TFIIH/NER complex subunit [Coemansia javaensis]|uniref:RNA polymerase II transcription factor B subunit 3 n=1 Tax=Coemansia javaensis TaxID=2761396 RepID=A0A9W8H8M3_9FUNG|nr:TFIIH/NER complex subunit [Coemansia javaensis]
METFAPAKGQNIPACWSDDDACPQCKSGRYLNQSMRLLASPCYHRMCEECVSNRFDAGPAPCPECHRILRKAEFYQPVFEDLTVENEVRIRHRLAMTFNKREEDFKSAPDYNAYLEMVEDMVIAYLHSDDTDELDARIERYKRDNQDNINKNRRKQQYEEKVQTARLEQDRRRRQQQLEEDRRQREDERREKAEVQLSMINELASSDKDAKDIVRKKMIQLKKSSLRQRSSARKAQADIESLLGTIDGGFDDDDDDEAMDDEAADAVPFDPAESPYAPVRIELRDKYDDANPAFRQPALAAAGVTREMHQRYMLEGAMAGLFVPPLAAAQDEAHE